MLPYGATGDIAKRGRPMRVGEFGRQTLLACIGIVGALSSALAEQAHAQLPHVTVTAEGTCVSNDLIEKPTREAVDRAALNFAETLEGNAPGSAEALVAQGAKAKLTADALTEMGPRFAAMVKGAPTVSLTYLVKVAVQTKTTDTAGCPVPGGSGKWDHVDTVNVPEQAHVLMTSAPGAEQTTVEVWLVPEDGAWRVNGFWANYTRRNGVSGDEAWANAKRERAAGHAANAVHWYQVAYQLLYLGPYFTSSTHSDLVQDARSFAASLPAQPRATPPT